MSALSIPNTIGGEIQAAPLNENFAAIQAAVNNIDQTNIAGSMVLAGTVIKTGADGIPSDRLVDGAVVEAKFCGTVGAEAVTTGKIRANAVQQRFFLFEETGEPGWAVPEDVFTDIPGILQAVTVALGQTVLFQLEIDFCETPLNADFHVKLLRDAVVVQSAAQGYRHCHVSGERSALTLLWFDAPGAGAFTYKAQIKSPNASEGEVIRAIAVITLDKGK